MGAVVLLASNGFDLGGIDDPVPNGLEGEGPKEDFGCCTDGFVRESRFTS